MKRAARPGVTVLVGAGSIYRIIPCSEAAALKAIDAEMRTPLMLVELPPGKELAEPVAEIDPEEDDNQEDEDPWEDVPERASAS